MITHQRCNKLLIRLRIKNNLPMASNTGPSTISVQKSDTSVDFSLFCEQLRQNWLFELFSRYYDHPLHIKILRKKYTAPFVPLILRSTSLKPNAISGNTHII